MNRSWKTLPLWSVATVRRELVEPTDLGEEVVHYSIPSVDATGTGQLEKSESIKSAKLRLSGGEVLISKLNPRKSRVISVAASSIPTVSSTEFVGLRAGSSLDSRYLTYLLQSDTVRQELDARVQSVTRSHQRVAPEDITHLNVAVAPLAEQRRIADFLDAETARIDGLAHLRCRQIDKIDERYNTAISELTTPGISSASERNEFWPWLPATVKTGRLGYVARVQSGVTVHGARARTSSDSEFPYLRVANVQGERLDLSEVKTITIPFDMARRSTLLPGDVVMTEANGNPDNLGRGAVWNGEIPHMVHQNHVFAIRVDRSRMIPEYLAVLLAASHGRRYFRFTAAQVGIATTSSSKVLDFPVPVLSLSEQRVIVKRWGKARNEKDRTANLLTRQLGLLTERRQALITAAVTGQFDVSTASGRNVTDGVTA
ncbi:hypothetical protein [Streptomyces sp. SCA2-2]|uniref:restriction endonuclease subunit S n=1 Tax=Streptomyces sp. SCA2-2 TaxID=1563677 RepID=UPI001022711D|nr:hypothetical protein [Streptomyces sp. SCA2-2]